MDALEPLLGQILAPWGGDYELTRLLLKRGLALVYLVAFLVTANQFVPLLGEDGLLPVPRFLEAADARSSPSLFHLAYSDRLATGLAWTGVALAATAALGLPAALGGTPASMAAWATLWLLYLSFVNVGQVFYGYGWESLMLESGFLAVFLGAGGSEAPEAVIWLYRWVLFRVMFGAGLIKIRGDECWRELTCLHYHHETQPLPNPLSWFFHHLPGAALKGGVALTHVVQLAVPFFYFAPDPARWVAGGLTVLFQLVLILSGNLSWLNWLTMVLAMACFDDALLGAVLPLEAPAAAARPLAWNLALGALVLGVGALSVGPVRNMLSRRQRMNVSFDPLHLVNSYGAFGSVTRTRNEIVLEGTRARRPGPEAEWREYEFEGKPGDPRRRPPWVAPYHLRLDWQMWFAAMSPPRRNPWLVRLAEKLLEGDEDTLGLLADDPFPERPPRHVRARLYRYRFTDPGERRRTGRWWSRTLVGEYLPVMSR